MYYGISQNPYTKSYIMVFDIEYFEMYCMKCNKIYTKIQYKWCKSCQLNYLKKSITSGNKRINSFIQEIMQLKINYLWDSVFEWIPYNQFNNIGKVINNDIITAYLAVWKNGPLRWNSVKYMRDDPNTKVALKFYNSRNINDITNEFINEV